jgi:erythromycin esterase-like protein
LGTGIEPKAVVWAHNSHLGDARYTEMGRSHGEFNIGQLCREHFGSAVFSLGCLSHTGTVAAAYAWGDDMEVMPVNPSLFNSYERVLHDTGLPSFVLDLRAGKMWSHYAEAVLPKQFDAVVWFDTSQAVNALETRQPHTEKYYEETYPFGL